ncbi:hypothetical protein RRG08_039373 [Elysia crispata]|uniref:DNA helicase Pif1-like 2B domain-containing protein n=1 Tax=Elysia crispata TaxID=231223 RepID=A0AAE0XW65_9GAST|nr:hypothetical protein RRG08_039373 [Elysia crispata]
MLLRNLNPSQGLLNGTRLLIKTLRRRVIQAKIMTGTHAGHMSISDPHNKPDIAVLSVKPCNYIHSLVTPKSHRVRIRLQPYGVRLWGQCPWLDQFGLASGLSGVILVPHGPASR